VTATALAVALVFVYSALPAWILAFPIGAFIALAVWHDRVLRTADCLQRAIAFYDRGLARVEDRWQGTGETGARFLDEDHLYARALDLFGEASLFQLIMCARTHLGEEVLARWLTTPAELATIRLRQEAIAELRGQLDFREALRPPGAPHATSTRER
jgi:hypothetical protein